MTLHSALTTTDLHEPKDVAAAAANRVYLADGAGSGSWTTIPIGTITGLNNSNLIYIRGKLTDLSTAASVYVPCPLAGKITKVITVLQGVIATTNATLRLRIGGTPVTDSDVTVAFSGSAAGDVDTAVPTAANTVTADSAIEIQNLGTGTTAEDLEVIITIDVS